MTSLYTALDTLPAYIDRPHPQLNRSMSAPIPGSPPVQAAQADAPAHYEDDSAETPEAEEKLRSGIQSIEVGFRLLEVLTQERRAMMLRDLALAAGMSPAKAHRYLVSFLRLGVVAQDPVSGRYELGGFALQMGLARLARVDGVKLARIALTALRDQLDQTVGIAVWGNQGPTIVHWMESSHPAKAALKLGDVMPLTNSATGLLFCAYLPRSKTQAMLEQALSDARLQHQPGVPQNAAELELLLDEVRRHQAARVQGTLLQTIDALAMPVFDANGDLALGVIALGQQGLFDASWDGSVDRALRHCAQRLSYELGYLAPRS